MSQENLPPKAEGTIRRDNTRPRALSQMGNRTLVMGDRLIDIVIALTATPRNTSARPTRDVAVGLARLGHDISLATMIGKDDRGARIAGLLDTEGVWLTNGSVAELPTSVATSTLERPARQHTNLTCAGAEPGPSHYRPGMSARPHRLRRRHPRTGGLRSPDHDPERTPNRDHLLRPERAPLPDGRPP